MQQCSCCLHSERLASLGSCDGGMHTTRLSSQSLYIVFFKPAHKVIIKNKVKIPNNAKNNYYNTQVSDICLAQSLWHVETYYILHTRNLKQRNMNSPFLKLLLHDPIWIASEVSNIRQPFPAHIPLCIQFPHSRNV